MNQNMITLYQKAATRMQKTGISDPTSIIAGLESEIESYRTKIKKLEQQGRLNHIQKTIGRINQNVSEIKSEDENFIYAVSKFGEYKYSKLKLAIFWLTHSNDCFYENFGFSWVPSNELQQLAREKLNEKSSVEVGIDFGVNKDIQVNHTTLVPEIILKDIMQEIDPIDFISHQSFMDHHFK